MKKYTNEFKVGLFVLLCIVGLLYLVFSTGKHSFKKGGYYIYAVFNDIAGLDKKAPVMLNGLEVGKVDDIVISYEQGSTDITLKLWLEDFAKVRENAVVSIKMLGLMGEKFIQITSTGDAPFIQPETVLTGKPYRDLDALIEEAEGMAKDIAGQVSKLGSNLNSTLEDNRSSISQIVKNLEATSKNIEEMSEDLKRHPWKLLFKSK